MIEISEIKESGSSSILRWAIANGADIKSDRPLQDLIHEELFYLVTFKNVNFLELFRLSQVYRDKLRVVSVSKAEVPSQSELNETFNGVYVNPENPEDKTDLAEFVELAVNNFVNIALQMETDSDIIRPNIVQLYLPMITRKITIQIPVSFGDIIDYINEVDIKKIFNDAYPETLSSIVENPDNSVYRLMQMIFMKNTTMIKYDPRLERYLSYVKYSPLELCDKNKLYKVNILSFHKYDVIVRGEVRWSMFNPQQNAVQQLLKKMGSLSSPLVIDFVIQLPIQLMQNLLNRVGPDMLSVSHESSMSSIVDGGLIFNDFIAPEVPEGEAAAEEMNNAISAYRTRINEANQLSLNCINAILAADTDTDYTSIFSILPSMYMTKCVVTVSVDKLDELAGAVNNDVLFEMIHTMKEMAGNINADIQLAMQ